MSEEMPLKVLGREIGTYTGWDGYLGTYIQFYDYKPNSYVSLEAWDCLIFNEETGMFQIIDDEGNPIKEWVTIEILKNVPKT